MPDRWQFELNALRDAGIDFVVDDEACNAGIARLRVSPVVAGERLELDVTFPDLYPYFRFVVEAKPTIGLLHHQAAIGPGTLCLLGRPTDEWHTNFTVAQLLRDQLPRVLVAGRSEDRSTVESLEAHQAEPASDYYSYDPAMLLIDGGWRLPDTSRYGSFDALLTGVHSGSAGQLLVYGVVVEVRGEQEEVLARADEGLRKFPGDRIVGRWTRSENPVLTTDGKGLFESAERLDRPGGIPELKSLESSGTTRQLRLQLRALVFPEEHSWRDTTGEGWVFAIRWNRGQTKASAGGSRYIPAPKQTSVPKTKWDADQFVVARAGRAGPEDLRLRLPELSSMRDACVSVVGLGCLGAPSALEFARAQVGELRLLDDDYVDPGTVVRWPLGLSVAGRPKGVVIHETVARDYPFTKVVPELRRLGVVRPVPPFSARDGRVRIESDEELLERFTAGTSLLYDASAEFGVQHYLSEFARMRGLPYIAVAGTQGGWGGWVIRVRPGITQGCWVCMQTARTLNEIPEPPAAGNEGLIQPAGCADPTFTGAGFDMASIALHGVRMAASTLCAGTAGGYPTTDWDVAIIAFRDSDGRQIVPTVTTLRLDRHAKCPACAERA